MAGRGPAPKPASERARRNADPAPEMFVEADDEMRGPDLPDDLIEDRLTGPIEWPGMTRRWWTNWRKSAQAQTFTDTDWDFLLETALIHRRFIKGEMSVAGELRLRVAKFGATPEDRARLRMGIGKPAGNTEPAKPKPAAQVGRRERLLSVVEDAG